MQFLATMSGQSLPNIIKLFASKKASGALEIKEKDFSSVVWLNEGQIVYATTTDTITLKEAINSLNLIPSDRLQEFRQLPDDDSLDAILIEKGLVQDKLISYVRSHQIAETLYAIVELEKANYELKPNQPLQIGREDLLPKGYNWLVEIYQNMYNWNQIRSKIPRNIRNLKAKPLKNQELSKEEQKIYSLCDGYKELKDIILWSSTTYYKAYSLLSGLVSKGLIEFDEASTAAMNEKVLADIVKVLDNMEQMPGIKNAFIVDREGKMLAKDSRRNHIDEHTNTETMAAIFSTTVTNFEENLKSEDEEASNEMIEQLLVERNNGDKTLLFVSGKFILVTEALKDCDWGLLRLSAKRSMNSIKQLVSSPG